MAAGLLDHAAGVAEGDLGAFLERAEGHVDHDQRLVGAAHHRLAMHDHVLERHAQRVGHAVDHHAQTVSYQKQVTDLIADMGHMGGVGGQADQRVAPLARHEVRHGHALALGTGIRICDGGFLRDRALGRHGMTP